MGQAQQYTRWSHCTRSSGNSATYQSARHFCSVRRGRTHFKIMATTLKDSVIHWRKKIERNSDEETILNVLRKLSKVPISIQLLQETHVGRVVRNLSKKGDAVGEKALYLLKKWRDVFAKHEEAKLKINSKKENLHKESTSSKTLSKHDVKHEKPHQKKTINDEHKSKRGESSISHSSQSSKTYMNDDSPSICKETSPSLYTYEKKESQAKYTDYDPHADTNEGYNPECPELYPGSKSLKIKSEILADTYKPSSVKQKPSSGTEKQKHKKLKTEKHSSSGSSHAQEAKQSTEKKEKHCVHKDKNKKDRKSDNKFKAFNCKKKLESNSSKHKLPLESKKTKVKKSPALNGSFTSKVKIKINCAEEFTSSEVRFEDCLGFNDIVTAKKKKTTKSRPFSSKSSTSKSSSSSKKPLDSIRITTQNTIHMTAISSPSKQVKAVSKREILYVPKPSVKLEEVDIGSTLPETMPTYRPLPQLRSLEPLPSKKKVLSNEEAIMFTSSRREKTAVYSGRKSFFTEVPSLFEFCVQKLIEHVDHIEHIGEIPYFIMKPVLVRCNPHQLFNIENHNPHLLGDTHELWEVHCKRDYKLLKRQECETWRELYVRAYEERETKLKFVTANICASMSKSNPVRQVKLAYVDSVAKPPRDVARRQAKHGTALPVAHPVKVVPVSKATAKPTAPMINSAASSVSTSTSNPKAKPKVAPLMAKTLKSMKMCFRR